MVWHAFEIIGTIAFAISGVLVGVQKKLDVFGLTMLSITTAVGGGIIRDTLIGNTPPNAFRDPTFIIISLLTTVAACFAVKHISKLKHTLQVCDAIGLGAFTATGASLTPPDLNPLLMMIVLGVITGVGGGILRDIFVQEIPLVFQKEVYAVAAVIGAVVFYLFHSSFGLDLPLYLCFAVTVIVRLICMRYNIQLPKIEEK